MNSAVLAFIFVYLAVPMFYNSMNYNILTIVFIFYIIDCVTMLSNECTNGYAILLSTIIGAGVGILSTSILMANKPSFLYYNAPANAEICSRPANQKFKCNVYKNGEILK
jgi:prepilin signal peptidase PulO-like enzyme (type II secretory pathway)